MFRLYLSSYANDTRYKISDDDSRKHMIVSDPEQANVFIINHDWIRTNRYHCEEALEKHLVPIVNNIVDNYPYYNRSQGLDHFFLGLTCLSSLFYCCYDVIDVAVYDEGPFCRHNCVEADKSQIHQQAIARIANASFIGK